MNGDQTPLLKYHLIFFACYLGGAILAGFLDPGMGASTVIGIALTLGSAYLALRSFRGDHGRGLDTDERWRMLKVGTIGVTGLTFAGMLFIKAVLELQPLALALGVRLPMWMVVVVSVVTAAFTALQLWLIPLVLALARDDLEWQGFLGLRLNLADDGSPRVVGLRTWPGAAEASLAMMRLQVDLAGMAEAALSGRLDQFGVRSNPHPCLAIGRIAEGEEIGRQIHGLDRRPPMEVKIFHAGTRQAQGGVEVARRDVLTVCALGTSLAECRLSADEVLGRISWADAPAPAWTGATG
jgi:hypothetical protein